MSTRMFKGLGDFPRELDKVWVESCTGKWPRPHGQVLYLSLSGSDQCPACMALSAIDALEARLRQADEIPPGDVG